MSSTAKDRWFAGVMTGLVGLCLATVIMTGNNWIALVFAGAATVLALVWK